MHALAGQVFAAGVRQLRGRVVGVDDCQGDEHRGQGWQYDYLEADYAAPFGGLCFADNVAVLLVAGGGAAGAAPRWRTVPDVGELLLGALPRCGAAGGETRLRVARPLAGAQVAVAGTIAADAGEQRLPVAVLNPTRFAARALHAALRARGIEVHGGAVDADDVAAPPPGSARELASVRSPELRAILVPTLKDSVNLYAEQLFRTAARVAGAGTGSEACERHAKSVLERLHVPTAGMLLADGSGLSRRNLVQPLQLAALLHAACRVSWREEFLAALPVAGVDGTLARRFATGPCRGRVRAKTGFVSYVVCLSGYLPRPGAQSAPIAFSAMLNNFVSGAEAAKAAADAFVDDLARAAGWPPE
jgi:D-alanyl-D-alanine carboxypeptidase/D-alanyl-D-alanine-endopeptidase (penicillin-binding protein 4)